MKRRLAALGVLLSVGAGWAQEAVQPSLAQAQESFAAKRYRDAAVQAKAVSERGTDAQVRLSAMLLEAKALINLPDYAAAETVLNGYVAARPQSAEGLYLLGFVLQRENKPKESLGVYTRAAAVATPKPEDLKLVALDYVLLNDYADAVVWLKRSLEGDPRNAEAWYFLGRAHMQQGDFREAERDFRRCLAITPGDEKASDNLGLSLAAQNRNEEAARAYRDAIAGQANGLTKSEQPFLNLGTLLNDENRSEEALPLLRLAAEIAPKNVRCYEELSRALVATEKQEEAIRVLEQAVRLDKANPSLHFRLGQLYRKAGEGGKADAEMALSKRLFSTHSTDKP